MKNYESKKLMLILEFGIPHYRFFILEYFRSIFGKFKIVHNNEKFCCSKEFEQQKGINIKLFSGISLFLFNVFELAKWDIIISTFNIRKPHTWLPIFMFPERKWILWGQGLGKTKNKFLLHIRKSVINRSCGYVAYNEDNKKELIEFGIEPDKISVAYNTLKINNCERTNGDEYLMYIGRVQKRKGLDKVLRALQFVDIPFLIVGDGSYLSVLQKIIKDLNIEHKVKIVNAVYDEVEIKELFSKAIAYISPDHVGLGVVHSFAYGVPVITCKYKDHAPEFKYCSNNNSFIYNHDHELLKTIEFVVKNKDIRKLKGENAYSFYHYNLHYSNMINAFNYHLERLNINETNSAIIQNR